MQLTKTVANKYKRPEIFKMYLDIVNDVLEMGLEFKGILDTTAIYHISGYNTLGQCRVKAGHIYIGLNLEYVENCLANNHMNFIKNTLVHEICHALKNTVGHGEQWKAYARRLGRFYGIEINRLATTEESAQCKRPARVASDYNYKVFCPECGAQWLYKSNCGIVRYPARYSCGKCKVELQSKRILHI